jgi:HKD family nuclease
MRLVVQSPARPERIISALEDMIEKDISEIRLCVAYITLSGTGLLIDRLEQALGGPRWEKVQKQILTCFDYGCTEPSALQRWASLSACSVYTHNVQLLSSSSLNPKTAFHAKTYEFRTEDHANLMVGSANLSDRALICNSEAAVVHTGITDLKSLDRAWTHLRSGASEVDVALINAYDAFRAKHLPVSPPPVSPVTTEPSQNLWDAITHQSVI